MTTQLKLWPLAFTLVLAACGAPATDPGLLADDGELSQDDEKADGAASVSTYYWISPDLRRCISPMCGGFYVQRVNKTTTRCVDNVYRASCYVADIDFGGADPRGVLLVRGSIAKDPSNGYGRFTASEAYRAQDGVRSIPTSAFYKVQDRGLRCIKAPCPQFSRAKLNDTYVSTLDGVDLTTAGASDDEVAAAYDALYATGILATGVMHNKSNVEGRVFEASHLFQRVAAPPKTCYVGGCSAQICSDRDGVVSTCEARPEYGCYHTATCAVQADGECGWTQTATLQACLANAPF